MPMAAGIVPRFPAKLADVTGGGDAALAGTMLGLLRHNRWRKRRAGAKPPRR